MICRIHKYKGCCVFKHINLNILKRILLCKLFHDIKIQIYFSFYLFPSRCNGLCWSCRCRVVQLQNVDGSCDTEHLGCWWWCGPGEAPLYYHPSLYTGTAIHEAYTLKLHGFSSNPLGHSLQLAWVVERNSPQCPHIFMH